MAKRAKKRNVFVYLKSSESKYRYTVLKNDASRNTEKLEFRKYDPILMKHVTFREERIRAKRK